MSTLLAASFVAWSLAWSVEPAAADRPPDGPGLRFIDVGQGSALLIRDRDGALVVIDSGPAGAAEAVLAALLAEDPEPAVALWIHSHYDADHLGGFARIVAGVDGVWPSADDVELGQVWDRGLASPIPETDAAGLYFALAAGRRAAPEPGARYLGAGLEIEVLALDPPPADAPENARGLALCVELDGLRALLPGDLPAERLALAAAACGPVDLLWLGHHGSADAISAEAIALADPRLSVVSAGHDNRYCHPSAITLALLGQREVRMIAAAGLEPSGECPAIAPSLGPQQRLLGADLWVSPGLREWIGGPSHAWRPL